jgi:hypothetical protein
MRENISHYEQPLFSEEHSGPLTNVWAGMRVLDAGGALLGEVEDVKMGDPEAATARGSIPPADLGTVIIASVVGGEPDVPEPKRSQLLRYGYIKVDGSGLSDTDRYIRSDKIANVAGSTITLNVLKARLLEED